MGTAICLAIPRGREGDHSPGCVSGHLHDVRVIKIQDRDSRWHEALNQLGLGIAYAFNGAKAPKVCMPDHQFNSGVRWSNPRQICDMSRSRGSHFQNKVARRFISPQNRQRKSDLIIKRQLRSNSRGIGAHNRCKKVLGRCFAHRTGHCDHVQFLARTQI